MPSRHSKNATATTHFTYHERQAAGHGTLKRRFGQDAQLAFGSCCLCLASTFGKEPMVSPSGYLFCKECIYSNLLAQKRAIQENLDAYERFIGKQHAEKAQATQKEERARVLALLDSSSKSSSAKQPAALPASTAAEDAERTLREKVDRTSDDVKYAAVKKTSFWAPDCTPEAAVTMERPDAKTRDPMSNEVLKLKQLMPTKLEWSTENGQEQEQTASASARDSSKFIICALTKKVITHHPAVLLRPSGIVMLESCVKELVLPTMTCPISGLKLRKKDIVKLQTGGTGFSAHSTVEAKKYRPAMT